MAEHDALAWAIAKHGNQRYGDQPYATHLRAVVAVVEQHGGSPAAIMAAALHDVVEDVEKITPEDVSREFGTQVSQIVSALSKPPHNTENRLEVYFQGIRSAGPEAVLVKLADRICNVRASVSGPMANSLLRTKYAGEAALFEAILRRAGEHEELWRDLAELLAQPMDDRVSP